MGRIESQRARHEALADRALENERYTEAFKRRALERLLARLRVPKGVWR